MTRDELLKLLMNALEPFTGFVDKDGEKIVLKWGDSTYTGLLNPKDFAKAREVYHMARSRASFLGE